VINVKRIVRIMYVRFFNRCMNYELKLLFIHQLHCACTITSYNIRMRRQNIIRRESIKEIFQRSNSKPHSFLKKNCSSIQIIQLEGLWVISQFWLNRSMCLKINDRMRFNFFFHLNSILYKH